QAKGAYSSTGEIYANVEEAILSWEFGQVDMHAPIKVRIPDGRIIDITVGRLLWSQILPEDMRWWDLSKPEIDKKMLRNLIKECYKKYGEERTAQFLDDMKELGFRISTKAGVSFSVSDLNMPSNREEIIKKTEEEVERINKAFQEGIISPEEEENQIIQQWNRASEMVTAELLRNVDMFNPVVMMAKSGTRGSERQIVQ
ncbi:MAG: DNA-directed RNA polymerase subunit beta', partial [Chloroflexi bacterium]|nr:DNA-directed RNA polymerase subunit beta' [Chloroflexota bacterium]